MTEKSGLNKLEQVRLLIANTNFDDAHKLLKETIDENAYNESAFNLLGAIYEKSGNIEGAGLLYRIALKINPDYLPAKANLHRLTQTPPISTGLDLGSHN